MLIKHRTLLQASYRFTFCVFELLKEKKEANVPKRAAAVVLVECDGMLLERDRMIIYYYWKKFTFTIVFK